MPTIIRKNKHMFYIFTSQGRSMQSKELEVASYKELENFIYTKLTFLGMRQPSSFGAGNNGRIPKVPLLIKERNPIKMKTIQTVCESIGIAISELSQKNLDKEVIIQPLYNEKEKIRIITRVFLYPPHTHVFNLTFKENQELDSELKSPCESPQLSTPSSKSKTKPPIIAHVREGLLRILEEQAKCFFEVLYKMYFIPNKLKLDGMAIDFIQPHPNCYAFESIKGFKISPLISNVGENIVIPLYKGTIDCTKKCYGEFCQEPIPKDSFADKLAQFASEITKAPKNASTLYTDIYDYKKDFAIYQYFYRKIIA